MLNLKPHQPVGHFLIAVYTEYSSTVQCINFFDVSKKSDRINKITFVPNKIK